MTATQAPRMRIVVGVDRSPSSRDAVLWAAEEARIRRCALVITHVDPLNAPGQPPRTELLRLLQVSAEIASSREPGVAVGTILMTGSVSGELIRHSSTSALLVVGVDPGRTRAAHGLLGPLEDRVVAQSVCPVVVVPGHRPAESRQHGGVVCWLPDRSGWPVVEAAVKEADLRGAALTILTEPGEPCLPPEVTDTLRRTYPQQVISVESAPTDPVVALRAHSETAEVLVLGSDHSADRWSIRTGSVAGRLMRESSCPVMLVGGRPASGVATAQHSASVLC